MQRIPFNRPLATLLEALACKEDVEQMQRIPFNRLLATFLEALACKGDVEPMQRIPFNRLLVGRRRIGELSPRSGHKTDVDASPKARAHIPTRIAAHPGHNRIAPIAPIWKMQRAQGHIPNCTDCAALPQALVLIRVLPPFLGIP